MEIGLNWEKFAARMMTPQIVLWVYIVLLVAGGLVGYIKARSRVSLITSLLFAVALSLCATGIVTYRYAADALLMLLLLFFGWRFSKGKKFVPGGLMSILSAVALALRHLL